MAGNLDFLQKFYNIVVALNNLKDIKSVYFVFQIWKKIDQQHQKYKDCKN